MSYDNVYTKLKQYNQLHLLKFYSLLNEQEKTSFLSEIDSIDFEILNHSVATTQEKHIEPISVLTTKKIEENKDKFYKTGIKAIKENKVATVLLAGGQGTRLGFDNPKGLLNVGITKEIYLFQILINNLLDIVKQANTWIYLYIMTSDKNNDETINFFKKHNYFGYNKEYIKFFIQDMAPAIDYDNKILLEAKNKVVLSPNGNGGWFTSLIKNGMLKEIFDKNIQWLNIFSVDNVLQKIADPVFIGATIEQNLYAATKVIKKASPNEKVGVICKNNGKPSIIEYYELTDEINNVVDENGEPAYNYGVTLNYLFNINSLKQKAYNDLPIHKANKKIPYVNDNGDYIIPSEPNGYKLETLVLDMIELYDDVLVYECERNKEFAPIKNRTGVDSLDTARELLIQNNYVL